jgi:hypothetical protein
VSFEQLSMTTLEPADVLTHDVVRWGSLCSAISTLPRSPRTTAPWRRGAFVGEVTGLMVLADGDKIMSEGWRVRRLKMPERMNAEEELTERREADTVPEAETKMGHSRRVRRPSGRFPSDVWTK